MVSTTDVKIAKANRLRLFREEGERAMKEVTENAAAVRKNMTRLRKLRLAKEAESDSIVQAASLAKPANVKHRMK